MNRMVGDTKRRIESSVIRYLVFHADISLYANLSSYPVFCGAKLSPKADSAIFKIGEW